jgi:phosphoribosylformylglycinamidine synthase subunit PurQ / glutaminase
VGQVLKMPVAHGDGRFVADEATLRKLEAERRVVVRYVNRDGGAPTEEINGSVNQIAGIVNDEGNVVGLMPHPDRASDPALGNTDGLGFFASGVADWRTGGPADERTAEPTHVGLRA